MKRILALLFCVFGLGTFASAQYDHNFYISEVFVPQYCSNPGHNCWKNLPGMLAGRISVGQDGTLAIVKKGTTNTYVYNQTTGGWDALPFLATDIAVVDATDIYYLGTGGLDQAACGGPQSVLYWNGTSSIPMHGCLTSIRAGRDSTLRGINSGGGGLAYYMVNPTGSSQWTQYPGTGWTHINSSTATEWCGVESGLLYATSAGNTVPAAFAPQPTGTSGTVVDCAINGMAPDQDILLAWNSSGLQFYDDVTANAWNTVGVNLSGISDSTAFGEGSVLQADGAGNVYLYNVYMGSVGLQMTGTWNNCPTTACPSPAPNHNYNMSLTLPGGISSARSISGGIPSTQAMDNFANAYDYTPNCSWTFSTPSDPGCKPTVATGSIVCGLTGATLLAVSAPQEAVGKSYDARIFDGTYQSFGYVATANGASMQSNCGIDKMKGANACAPGTTATCPSSLTQKLVRDRCIGNPASTCSETVLDTAMRTSCGLFKPGGLAWAMQRSYVNMTDNGKHYVACLGTTHFFVRKYPVQCQ